LLTRRDDLDVVFLRSFNHMLDLKQLSVHWAASIVLAPDANDEFPRIEVRESPARQRFLISIAEAWKDARHLTRAEFQPDMELVLLLHEAMVRLMTTRDASPDPMEPLREPIERVYAELASVGELPVLAQVLHMWLPENEPSPDLNVSEVALVALVNAAKTTPADLLSTRFPLVRAVLWDDDEAAILPVPPGVGMPGLLAICNRTELRRVDFTSPVVLCPALVWSEDTGRRASWRQYRAPLVVRQILEVDEESRGGRTPTQATLTWISQVFRNLAEHYRHEPAEQSCVVTAYHILGLPPSESVGTTGTWEPLGYRVAQNRLSGQAFIRHGRRGLVPEAVPEMHDNLWRIGTAIADWLGYVENSASLKSLHLSARALGKEGEEEWIVEAMLRFGLHRLRGAIPPVARLSVEPQSDIPLTIERVLKRFEEFPSGKTASHRSEKLAFLLSTLAEGRALYHRGETTLDPAMPGGVAMLLAEMVRPQFKPDETLAKELPGVAVVEPPIAVRRPALAWHGLSERLARLASLDPLRHEDVTISALAAGARIISLATNVRSQALEHWASLDSRSRSKLVESALDLSPWNLDSTCLLIRPQTGGSAAKKDLAKSDASSVSLLLRTVDRATADNSASSWNLLDEITPLGWMVVLGVVSGLLRGSHHGRGTPLLSTLTVGDQARISEGMARLATAMAANAADSEADPDDYPWGDLKAVIQVFSPDFTRDAFECLALLDAASGFRVEYHESRHFRMSGGRDEGREVDSSDGLRQLASWQICVGKLVSEHPSKGTERYVDSNTRGPATYCWSETWCQDRLLSIGVLQPALASLAGFERGVPDRDASALHATVPSSPQRSETDDEEAGKQSQEVPADNVAEAESEPEADGKGIVDKQDVVREDEFIEIVRSVRAQQESHWRTRTKLIDSHARIALLQWDVDESYRHPIFDACMRDDERIERYRKKPHDWNYQSVSDYRSFLPSCAEYRRQRILEQALRACRCFDVDILLLPEYSVRPDTVESLKEQLRLQKLETAVWAGTYRHPPYMLSNPMDVKEWSAVLRVLYPKLNDAASVGDTHRTKKYPSVSAHEVFNPRDLAITPILDDTRFDALSYVMELICSEVFLATSPSNIPPIASAYRELCRTFGLRDDPSVMNNAVHEDLTHLAECTSICCSQCKRRSILLVPAMTRRAADFAILGQAGFLAAGLTTVLCNAVCGAYGHGKSCFIGHDGWNRESNLCVGIPTLGPYHGVFPGIYRPGAPSDGCLGKSEQALVIADIDPVFSFEGRPRPQMLPVPLRLIAHLPIIESWSYERRKFENSHFCRCKLASRRRDFAGLFSAFEQVIGGSQQNTAHKGSHDAVIEVLEKLQRLGDREKTGWLTERLNAYRKEHAATPNRWPPPAATDWLWVDLGDPIASNFPDIEVPPYTVAPGEHSSEGR
jgi:hypothetical protein